MPDEGFRKWLGVDYEVMEDGHAVVGLTLTDDMRNLRGVAQGGIVAAIIDIAMATAAAGGNYDTRKRPMATLEMKVNYVAAANGPRLTATAGVVRAGHTGVRERDVRPQHACCCHTGGKRFTTQRNLLLEEAADVTVAPEGIALGGRSLQAHIANKFLHDLHT